MNSNLYVANDLVIGGNLSVKQYTNENIIHTTINDYDLIVSEDLSLNGNMSISGDVSLNKGLAVDGDVIFNKNVIVNGDLTIGKAPNNVESSAVFGVNSGSSMFSVSALNDTALGFNSLTTNVSGAYNTAVG